MPCIYSWFNIHAFKGCVCGWCLPVFKVRCLLSLPPHKEVICFQTVRGSSVPSWGVEKSACHFPKNTLKKKKIKRNMNLFKIETETCQTAHLQPLLALAARDWRFCCCLRSLLGPRVHFLSEGNWLIRGLTRGSFHRFSHLDRRAAETLLPDNAATRGAFVQCDCCHTCSVFVFIKEEAASPGT